MEGFHYEEAAAADQTETYKCPVLGCERNFTEFIHLHEHKRTAHADQWLHDNSDGTFSVVNKETNLVEEGPFAGIRPVSPDRIQDNLPALAPPSSNIPQQSAQGPIAPAQGSAQSAQVPPPAHPGTQNFLIEGRSVNVPILSTNTSGVSNAQKCGPCLRGKRGVDCTGPIPICDQCQEKGYDEEICTSNRKIAEIRAERRGGQ